MINEEKDRKPNPYYEMFTDGIRVVEDEKRERKEERGQKRRDWALKQCIACEKYKLENDFYKCNQTKDGLQLWCKDCCKLYYNLKVQNAKT